MVANIDNSICALSNGFSDLIIIKTSLTRRHIVARALRLVVGT